MESCHALIQRLLPAVSSSPGQTEQIICMLRHCNIDVLTCPINACAHSPPRRGLLLEPDNSAAMAFLLTKGTYWALTSSLCIYWNVFRSQHFTCTGDYYGLMHLITQVDLLCLWGSAGLHIRTLFFLLFLSFPSGCWSPSTAPSPALCWQILCRSLDVWWHLHIQRSSEVLSSHLLLWCPLPCFQRCSDAHVVPLHSVMCSVTVTHCHSVTLCFCIWGIN